MPEAYYNLFRASLAITIKHSAYSVSYFNPLTDSHPETATVLKKIILAAVLFLLASFIAVMTVNNYYQRQNINQLLAQNLDGRLIPHKADYSNKLKNILSDNIKSFEFDTLFNASSNPAFFEVGHDRKNTNGTSFESYLELSRGIHLIKIWMDIKNITQENIKAILKRLNYLDRKYGIKNIMIFETSSSIDDVRIISDAGYHTSYYLPPGILLAMAKNDVSEMQKQARRIKKQIAAQHLKAISFPLSQYGYVKTYVEPIIADDISYHTWGAYRFRKKNELIKIQHEKPYSDQRIKTIIYTYYNNKFNRLYDF